MIARWLDGAKGIKSTKARYGIAYVKPMNAIDMHGMRDAGQGRRARSRLANHDANASQHAPQGTHVYAAGWHSFGSTASEASAIQRGGSGVRLSREHSRTTYGSSCGSVHAKTIKQSRSLISFTLTRSRAIKVVISLTPVETRELMRRAITEHKPLHQIIREACAVGLQRRRARRKLPRRKRWCTIAA